MGQNSPYIAAAAVEATVSSKGQVTLPKALRDHLGIQTGSRIRLSLAPHGGFEASHLLYELEDLWKMSDQAPKAREVMIFEEMNQAKARRKRAKKRPSAAKAARIL